MLPWWATETYMQWLHDLLTRQWSNYGRYQTEVSFQFYSCMTHFDTSEDPLSTRHIIQIQTGLGHSLFQAAHPHTNKGLL